MKRLAFLAVFALTLGACQSGPHSDVSSVPGRGALAISIVPNPIVAKQVSGATYDFPFEVIVRETGGRPVEISRVSATVYLAGGINLGNESWDAEKIHSMGYSTTLAPHGELRYQFHPRKEVPDERLFGGVSAELRVEGYDDAKTGTNASTVVTVTR